VRPEELGKTVDHILEIGEGLVQPPLLFLGQRGLVNLSALLVHELTGMPRNIGSGSAGRQQAEQEAGQRKLVHIAHGSPYGFRIAITLSCLLKSFVHLVNLVDFKTPDAAGKRHAGRAAESA
jgi:hypothetical protein